ncbi:MAG: hypothetical protein CBC23_012535 [Rhodospirillaceae bacterium TMED63]|nr:MAG: hypothetical protein CBC23_012535 [Rhodospirillaceae bacterium TMED63]
MPSFSGRWRRTRGLKKESNIQFNPPYRFRASMSAADINFGVLGFAQEPIKPSNAFAARTDAGCFTLDARCLPAPFARAFSLCACATQRDIYS